MNAGVPESYFRSQDVEGRVDGWRIRKPDGSFDFGDFLRCVLKHGSTPNGIFAVRIMWGTMEELLSNLRSLGIAGNDREVLESAFGSTRFVYLRRQDVVAQAVSRFRAEQTNVWHIKSQSDRGAEQSAVRYDRVAIQRFLDESIEHDQAWNRWFQQNGISPFRLRYEDLDRDSDLEARKVLDFVGVAPPDYPIEAPNVRMADAVSREWVERFRAETGYQGDRHFER